MAIQPQLYGLTQSRPESNRYALPASWMRCGTSKGLFLNRQHLPKSQDDWKPWLMAAMGSRADDMRQIDGIGGATSTTSKVAVVSKSMVPGVDVEYTFAQVAVGKEVVDFSGNCGNIASGVGPFALAQRMIEAKPGATKIDIRILNKNTNSILVESVEIDQYGDFKETGDFEIAGVTGTGSQIKVSFIDPAGTLTNKLFPTGNKVDMIQIHTKEEGDFRVKATMIDAGNPFVFLDGIGLARQMLDLDTLPLELLEIVRREAAVMMGLAANVSQAASQRGTPKLAILWPPESDPFARKLGASMPDISVVSLSMGSVHPSLQLTGAVALSSALSIHGTLPFKRARRLHISDMSSIMQVSEVKIEHPSGCIEVEVEKWRQDNEEGIARCSLSRTARTLFEGQVLFRL